MKTILHVFVLLAFSSSFIFADNFTEIREISLKKDEQKKILVKYADKEKLFNFRWTLYKNGGLVIFRSYDKIVAQNVLYLRERNQSFRVELKSRGADFYNVPYMLVRFKEFKEASKEAVFEILLSDDKKQIKLEDLKKG
ncbi:MAG: hypothetical protein A2513_02525 [Sulfurimonas sp. RIFOXYD12_FULL_33_39]|uniref:hypothetical protein n=1 Tax=unclassified Sulfurimonas TaxID=2623549 RepID=UPI0008AEEFCF|nr:MULTISPECIES: hypothetical protein [unclassified Sulfurimonas]OHE08879.1 MAG: hypothetical protein A2513_02525 [Sulfurimonas sp. RIFOXYD12_FULL_33_39]OHE14189.1 MAG: hypothetical protein A2530_05825 [Sulfurimonas sp. RIFOXYD2_FULL_34_21]